MILITGANGQLGKELTGLIPGAILTDAVPSENKAIQTLDITNSEMVNDFVNQYKIETVINCAAYTAVDKAENDIDKCFLINQNGPRNLAKTGKKIIHISTDYVFDGKGTRPYTESDSTNPMSIYGQSKMFGEHAVLNNSTTGIVIRTSWLYSPFGNNFVKTMQRLGAEKLEINVVADQFGTPTYAHDLSVAIKVIADQLKPGTKGVYHYSNNGQCSWFDFAAEIMKLSGLSCRVNPIGTLDYPTPAPRPAYSVLDKSKIKNDYGIFVPDWQDSLRKCITRMK